MKPTARQSGFTMIELLVVLAIIALLLTIAAPRYFGGIDTAKQDVLREDLYTMRQSLDQFYSDNGHYPAQLADLVTYHYLRQIPVDPITQSSQGWVVVAPADPSMGNVFDVKSSAPGTAPDGTYYQNW
jgi:general secretion pathway protein G